MNDEALLMSEEALAAPMRSDHLNGMKNHAIGIPSGREHLLHYHFEGHELSDWLVGRIG